MTQRMICLLELLIEPGAPSVAGSWVSGCCKYWTMPTAVSRFESPVTRCVELCVAVAVVLAAACGCSHDGGSAQKAAGVHVPENFCSLLSASDISRVMGSAYPEAQGSQSPSEAQCTSIPTAGNDVSYKLYWNNEYCIDGKPVDQQCLDSQSKGFVVNKQSAGRSRTSRAWVIRRSASWLRPRPSTYSRAGST